MQNSLKNIQFVLYSCLSSLFLVFVLVNTLQASTIWYISPNGDDDNSCLTSEDACATIQSVLDEASLFDTIMIASGTYTQNTVISKSIILQGEDRETTIINGNQISHVFSITVGSDVQISGLTIMNGNATHGGGIFNEGSLSLADCKVEQNSAIGIDGDFSKNGGDALGGGIYNSDMLLITNCDVINNIAVGGNNHENRFAGDAFGGGLYSSGILTISNSVFGSNFISGGIGNGYRSGDAFGGGIYSVGLLASSDTQISNNVSFAGDGGGVYGVGVVKFANTDVISNSAANGAGLYTSSYLYGYSQIEINEGKFTQNHAESDGGAIRDTCANTLDCSLIISRSSIANNYANRGGGIYSSGASAESTSLLTITQSTINNNEGSSNGGGIYLTNQIGGIKNTTIVNSTISGNSADNGGGLFVYTTSQSNHYVDLFNASVISNTAVISGSGIYVGASGSGDSLGLSLVTVKNSIVTNVSQNCLIAQGGNVVSNGNNLDSKNSCNFVEVSDITDTEPQLDILADNGGPTWTHALLEKSPAIDAGDNAVCQSELISTLDQRDFSRLVDGDGDEMITCDIGAYEKQIEEYRLYLPFIQK